MIKIYHKYETEKEGIKEGCGDINMRKAERQIQQIEYAFKLHEEAQAIQKFLVIGGGAPDRLKIWHPILDEMDVNRGSIPIEEKYNEVEVVASVKSLVPLEFKNDLQSRQANNNPGRGGFRGGRGGNNYQRRE